MNPERHFAKHHRYIEDMKERWQVLHYHGLDEEASKLMIRINKKIAKMNALYKQLEAYGTLARLKNKGG